MWWCFFAGFWREAVVRCVCACPTGVILVQAYGWRAKPTPSHAHARNTRNSRTRARTNDTHTTNTTPIHANPANQTNPQSKTNQTTKQPSKNNQNTNTKNHKHTLKSNTKQLRDAAQHPDDAPPLRRVARPGERDAPREPRARAHARLPVLGDGRRDGPAVRPGAMSFFCVVVLGCVCVVFVWLSLGVMMVFCFVREGVL